MNRAGKWCIGYALVVGIKSEAAKRHHIARARFIGTAPQFEPHDGGWYYRQRMLRTDALRLGYHRHLPRLMRYYMTEGINRSALRLCTGEDHIILYTLGSGHICRLKLKGDLGVFVESRGHLRKDDAFQRRVPHDNRDLNR